MATVITSIGSKSIYTNPVNGQFAITGSSGSGDPWTGTVSHAGSSVTANVGDMLFFRQVHTDCGGWSGCTTGPVDVVYLITAVNSGSDSLTIKYISGLASASSGQAPTVLSSNSYTFTQAQPYVLRFYSTPATWDTGLNDDDLYSDGDIAKGEGYDDSDFDIGASITIDGGGSLSDGSLDTVILSAAAGERHDGTAKEGGGSGVRFLISGAYALYINYRHSGATSINDSELEFMVNQSGTWTSLNATSSLIAQTDSSNKYYSTLKLPLTNSATDLTPCQSIMFRFNFDNLAQDSKFAINDITVEYRVLSTKAA